MEDNDRGCLLETAQGKYNHSRGKEEAVMAPEVNKETTNFGSTNRLRPEAIETSKKLGLDGGKTEALPQGRTESKKEERTESGIRDEKIGPMKGAHAQKHRTQEVLRVTDLATNCQK